MATRRPASDPAGRAATRRPRTGRAAAPPRPTPAGYWDLSGRPLHILAFVLPLVLLYELGSAVYLVGGSTDTHRTIQAQRLLGQFFEVFGAAGLFLPGVALLTVLLVWHILLGDRWRVELPVVGGMAVESAGWTLPLLVLAALHSRAASGHLAAAAAAAQSAGGAAWAAGAGAAGADLLALPWQARLTVSIGAGLYEEMLFRLLLIAFLHLILADLAGLRRGLASLLCIAGSALAFALYHDVSLPGGGTDWPRFLFFLASGVYLGTVYVLRGFGIVVGAHAIYDALVLVLLRPQ
jgi:hypothetical protein